MRSQPKEGLNAIEKTFYQIIFDIDNGANVELDQKRYEAAKLCFEYMKSICLFDPKDRRILIEELQSKWGLDREETLLAIEYGVTGVVKLLKEISKLKK